MTHTPDLLTQANALVITRATEEFREASERILDLLEKHSRAYRKNPSLARAVRLNHAIAWSAYIHDLVDCSCEQCWTRGKDLLAAVERLERGQTAEIPDWACGATVISERKS